MLEIMPENIQPDQTDCAIGVPDDGIQTTPIAPHASEAALEWSQPTPDTPAVSKFHPMSSFSERDKLIAYMELAGAKRKEIAKALGVSYATIMGAQRKPQYRIFISEEAKTLRESTHQSIQDRIMGDAHRNIDFLMQVRDGIAEGEAPVDWSNRRQAAVELFARQYPKVTKTETQEHHMYQFESNTLEKMMKTMAGAMEVNPAGKSPQEVIDILTEQLPPEAHERNGQS